MPNERLFENRWDATSRLLARLAVSSEDNPPGLRSVVHPVQVPLQSGVRRRNGGVPLSFFSMPLYLSVDSFSSSFRVCEEKQGPSTVSGEVYGDWPIPAGGGDGFHVPLFFFLFSLTRLTSSPRALQTSGSYHLWTCRAPSISVGDNIGIGCG